MGANKVAHFASSKRCKRNARIRITSIARFAAGRAIRVIEHAKAAKPNVVLRRAKKRIGESEYDLLRNNCEHFARYCKTGWAVSEQVELIMAPLPLLPFGLGLAGILNPIAATGFVVLGAAIHMLTVGGTDRKPGRRKTGMAARRR